MTAREVLDQAKAAGLTLTPEDGRILVTPPNASPFLLRRAGLGFRELFRELGHYAGVSIEAERQAGGMLL